MCDKCIYVKNKNHEYVIVCLYVDDMSIMGTNRSVIESTKIMLHSNFDIKNLGFIDVILEMITRNPEEYILSQSHCIEKVLRKFGHYKSKPAVILFDPNSIIKNK